MSDTKAQAKQASPQVDEAAKDRMVLSELARLIGELEVQNVLLRVELATRKRSKAAENGAEPDA